jgi:hypothetical protein
VLPWILYRIHGGGEGKTSEVDLLVAWGILTKGYRTEILERTLHILWIPEILEKLGTSQLFLKNINIDLFIYYRIREDLDNYGRSTY